MEEMKYDDSFFGPSDSQEPPKNNDVPEQPVKSELRFYFDNSLEDIERMRRLTSVDTLVGCLWDALNNTTMYLIPYLREQGNHKLADKVNNDEAGVFMDGVYAMKGMLSSMLADDGIILEKLWS